MKISQYILEAPTPKLTDAITVDESCLILPDVEVPYQHAQFINKCISVAKERKIKTLILPGDAFHWAALAHFPAADKDLLAEVEMIEDLIVGFLDPFERVKRFRGNHDARMEKSLDRLLPQKYADRIVMNGATLKEWERKVETSDRYWCWVGEGENRWRISHPRSTGSVPGNPARRMAEKFGCNFAMAHNHLVGMQQTQDGKHYGVEMGCCVDPERLAYSQDRDVTRPKMKLGALILEKHGNEFYPTLLADGWHWFG